jgi:predicted negative regulator of RcsB-dependent stress response
LGTKKIKISKKEADKIQKAQEIAANPVLSQEWLEEYSTRILAGFGVLLLVVGILWGFNAYGKSKEQRAQTDYARLLQYWPGNENSDPQAWEKVISELEAFLKDQSDTTTVFNAQLDLARAYFQTRQYELALQWNKKVLDKLPRDQDLKFLAQYQQAFALEALGKTDEAITVWNVLKGSASSEISKEADWNIARLYAGKGDYAKAAEQYESAMKATGGYPAADLLQEELASLKLKMKAPADQKSSSQ